MTIDFQKIQQYQKLFFTNNWLPKYILEQPEIVSQIRYRTDLLLEGKIIFDDALDMEACIIPYNYEKYQWNDYPEADPEWLYMFSRHGFMLDLALRYCIDQDERFLILWKKFLFDFIENNGTPNTKNTESWRPLDAGLRLLHWIKSLTYLPIEELFSKEEYVRFQAAVVTHEKHAVTSFIEKYYLSNWGILALSGALAASLLQLDSEPENEQIWSMLTKMMALQFDIDGVHWEQSPLYQHEVLMIIAYLVQISEYLSIKLPMDLRKQLAPLIKPTHFFANSQDLLTAINDSDQVDATYIYDYYRLLGFLPLKTTSSHPARLYAGAKYQGNSTIAFDVAFTEKDSGFMAYKDDNLYFTLVNGWHGSSHGHATTGSFTLQMGATPLLVDSGRYTYTEDVLRLRLKEEQAHNSLSIACSPATEIIGSWSYRTLAEPLGQKFYVTPLGFYAECAWRNTQDTVHVYQRRFMFIKEIKTLLIFDQVIGNQAPFIANFNYADDCIINEKDGYYQIKCKDEYYRHWIFNGTAQIRTALLSKIYNQESQHPRLQVTAYDKEHGPVISVISAQDLHINQVDTFQTATDSQLPQVGGLRLQNDQEKKWDVYYMLQDIVTGNKLFRSEYGHYFYGLLSVYDTYNHLIKIR